MTGARTFVDDLPLADIRLGPKQHIRIYGEPAETLGIPLVEIRLFRHGEDDHLHLHIEQAEQIVAGLTKAISKARGQT